MRNANSPSGPGKPARDAADKASQREQIDETFGDETAPSGSASRQPNLRTPSQIQPRQGEDPAKPQQPE